MLKIKRKLASFVLVAVMTLSLSLSALAEGIPEGIDVEHIFTEEHEHGVDNIASVDSSMGIMPLTSVDPGNCPHNFQYAQEKILKSTRYNNLNGFRICTEKSYIVQGFTVCMYCRYEYGRKTINSYVEHSMTH